LYTITLERPPCGYALNSVHPEEMVNIVTREFTSSEDGDLFITRLEGVPSSIINSLPNNELVKCSQIDLMVVFIKKNGECRVHLNDLTMLALVKPKKDVKKDDPVFTDDLADISEIQFEGVDIPSDEGVLILFSIGWRKGLFFDFGPVVPNSQDRNYNIYATLGHYYNYLFFQHLHKISDATWDKFFNEKWFPFIGLKKDTINSFINHLQSGWDCNDLLTVVNTELSLKLDNSIESWTNHTIIREHGNFILVAAERFKAKDYISCVSILYPRIEGILRSINLHAGSSNNSQKDLSIAPMIVSSIEPNYFSAVLPERFSAYLKNVYFANFQPNSNIDISRNSVSHGVAKEKDYSEKSAIIAFLVIEQIFFHMPTK